MKPIPVLMAAVALAALASPAFAQVAYDLGTPDQMSSMTCQTAHRQSEVGGGLLGALIGGLAIGSLSHHGGHDTGAALGTLAGAGVGSMVGGYVHPCAPEKMSVGYLPSGTAMAATSTGCSVGTVQTTDPSGRVTSRTVQMCRGPDGSWHAS